VKQKKESYNTAIIYNNTVYIGNTHQQQKHIHISNPKSTIQIVYLRYFNQEDCELMWDTIQNYLPSKGLDNVINSFLEYSGLDVIIMNFLKEWGMESLVDYSAMIKALIFATVTVMLLRQAAWFAKVRDEDEAKLLSEAVVVVERTPSYVSPTIHENDLCGICSEKMWSDSGIEISRASVIQLDCKHCFHRSCYLGDLDPKDTNLDRVMPCVIRGHFAPCLYCQMSPKSVSIQPLHKWQTISYWVLLINEALDMAGPHKYGVSWAEIRKKAREISGLSLDQLRDGDKIANGGQDVLEDEDLDGPGQFPFFAALRDGGCKKFTVDGVNYRGRSLWTSYMVSGVEKMISKYSWGIPPFTMCSTCDQHIDNASAARSCSRCGDLVPVMKYWCSDQCKKMQNEEHKKQCDRVCSAFEKFHIQRLPS
jgi:hypothetical protein